MSRNEDSKTLLDLYEPLATLKPVAENIWIADGSQVLFNYFHIMKIPFSTRMTVIQLSDGGLWVHSPIGLTSGLKAELAGLGPVKILVAPNKIHSTWPASWQAAYPEAKLYVAPGAEEKLGAAGATIDHTLGEGADPDWAADINILIVRGGFMTEVEFFHIASRTLVLTDLIENFEPDKIHSWFWRKMMKWFNAADPDGSLTRDLRATFGGKHRAGLKAAVETMIAWKPSRIVISHGRWYPENGVAELRRAFRWLL